ncbi:hypothetical protein [Micromonospora sp. NPDC047527]|uniref:hypothetical protein n=1 Tax=unclassified Micromonospora TaxID=2617518 RepID=UPI0033FAF408
MNSGDSRWNINLDNEANDAAVLFSHGLAITENITRDYTAAVAAMSLLALGAEKLLKLTVGLAHLDRGNPWPRQGYMRRDIGHRVATADKTARDLLDLNSGTAPGDVQEKAARVDGDKILAVALATLERFGDAGRFYFLDSLGEQPQIERAPHFLWLDMVSEIMTAEPGLVEKINTEEEFRQARAGINHVIVGSLTRWWDFYRSVWTTGVVGEQAKVFSSTIRLASR